MDLTEAAAPRSDQQNYDDLIGGPRTVTVDRVDKDGEGRISLHLVEYPGRPYKPCKTMLRVLIAAWTKDGDTYAGRRMTLYGDPEVKFGGKAVGGIRISHLSHIDRAMTFSLTETRGKRAPHTVQPLKETAPPPLPDFAALVTAATTADECREIWKQAKAAGVLTEELHEAIGARVAELEKGEQS